MASVVAPEVAGQLLPLDEKPRRPAVRAGDRFFGAFEVGQEAALLGHVEHVAEADGRMACQRGRRFVDPFVAAVLRQRRERLLDRRRRPARRELDRYSGDAQAARAELLVLETKFGELRTT